jgi:cytochrome c-type biogenesis protein CcmE
VSTLTNDPTRAAARPSTARIAPRTSTRPKPRARARFIVAALVILAAVGYMMYAAIQSGSEYFTTTSEIAAMGTKAVGQQMKIGGQVVDGSVKQERGSDTIAFVITDGTKELPVTFTGIIPDAFQPGAGVILEGKLAADGQFQANTMLAKCASKYEPK